MRRRLVRLAAVLVAAAVVALLIAFVPRGHSLGNAFSSTAQVQTVRRQRTVPLTRADRREIDRVLDGFVPAAVGRHRPIRARAFAAPDLLRGTTRRDWETGNIPAPPYPVRSGPTHEYVVLYSFRNLAGLELGLHPAKGAKVGNAAFFVTMKRVAGRWLVSSIAMHALYPP